jgi:hypothetical protein
MGHRSATGPPQVWGCEGRSGIFASLCLTRGGRVAWILRLVQIGADGEGLFADVLTIDRPMVLTITPILG